MSIFNLFISALSGYESKEKPTDMLEYLLSEYGHISDEDQGFIEKFKAFFEQSKSPLTEHSGLSDDIKRNEMAFDSVGSLISELSGEDKALPSEENYSDIDYLMTLRNEMVDFCELNVVKLFDVCEEVLERIDDGGKYVVTAYNYQSKCTKKINNAIDSYAKDSGEFIALFDQTTFGKADNGIYIDTHGISFKKMVTDPVYVKMDDIYDLKLSGKSLWVNIEKMEFFHTEIQKPLALLVKKVNFYLNQPAYRMMKILNNIRRENKLSI